jgi:hypothetical protein
MSQYIFYKIACEDCPEYVYIGSTKSFRSRKYQHKSSCNNTNNKSYNLKLYNKIRENGGWDNWSMNVIDEGNDLTFTQSRIKEEDLRIKYNGNLNSNKAFKKYEEHKKEYDKNLNKKNKNNTEKFIEYKYSKVFDSIFSK